MFYLKINPAEFVFFLKKKSIKRQVQKLILSQKLFLINLSQHLIRVAIDYNMDIADISRRVVSGLQRRWGPLFSQQVMNILAYGSGAMPQTRDAQQFSNNTLDLLVQVRHWNTFHYQLNRVSPDDYSGATTLFGPRLLEWSGRSVFPMHSNHIILDGRRLKYSIIGTADLREDLRTWKYLSFAGRLQKPIHQVLPLAQGLSEDMTKNREGAAAVALLLFGGKARICPQVDFFQKICEISYMGDIRFSAGAQNPNKVGNIVTHNFKLFQQIYLPILKRFSAKIPKDLLVETEHISFLFTAPSLAFLLPYIPASLLQKVFEAYPGERNLIENIMLAGSGNFPKDLKELIEKKNKRSSFWMASQNMISASPLQNASYLLAKLAKKKNK